MLSPQLAVKTRSEMANSGNSFFCILLICSCIKRFSKIVKMTHTENMLRTHHSRLIIEILSMNFIVRVLVLIKHQALTH